MRKYKLLTTWHFTNRLSDKIDIDYFRVEKDSLLRRLISLVKLLIIIRKYDAFLVAYPEKFDFAVFFLSKICLGNKILNVSYDILLIKPKTFEEKVKAKIKRLLFFGIDKFFCIHKDTKGYRKYFGIKNEKFHYIPFKANNYSILSNFITRDMGYILASGHGCRDYDTFIRAIKKLGFPAKIVLSKPQIAEYHNTILDEKLCPKNVSVIRHDFNFHTWNEYTANARIVVIPIKKGIIRPAGISVCLEAMALGKPVIITEGVYTSGIITKEIAEIVPAADPGALALAIEKLWNNSEYRKRIAKNGKEFALSLEGPERMIRDILNGICHFIEQSSA